MQAMDLDERIMNAAEQILKVNHGRLRASSLVGRLVDDCCEHMAPDVAFERVSSVLASAVRKKQLVESNGDYALPPPPRSTVTHVAPPRAPQSAPRSVRAGRRAGAGETSRASRAATGTPAATKQPIVIPENRGTVKVPPKPAPPPPPPAPEPEPFIDMAAPMSFTVEPVGHAFQPSLFDPTHPTATRSASAKTRRRPAQIAPPDTRPMRQASLLLGQAKPPPEE